MRGRPAVAWMCCLVAAAVFVASSSPGEEAPGRSGSRSATLLIDPDLQVPDAFDKDVPSGLEDLQAMERHVRLLSEKLRECIVSVQIGNSQGSGVIVSSEGYILTCAHVIGGSGRRCRVIFPDGTRRRGETLGANTMLDAGMIKLTETSPQGGWPHTDMAGFDSIKIGDWCLAAGHPGGFREDRPPVMRLGRLIFVNPRVLQTDCELVGGDSGGPLFDMHGRVIGVNSRIQDDPNANYHVPVSAYQGGWERMVAGEVFDSHSGALMGVWGEPGESGIKVTKVFEGEAADLAGLRVGDVIVTFNSQRVHTPERLAELVGEKNPGAKVSVEILRDGKPMVMEVTLQMRTD